MNVPPENYMTNYLDQLHILHPAAALAMIVLSVAFLARGWKFYKYLVALDALIGGGLAGLYIGGRIGGPHMDIYLGIGLALIFAATAWPLMKGSVCILGAMAGAAFGYVLWYYGAHALGYANWAQHAWAGALVGMVIVGMLTFIAFQTTVIIGLGLQGAFMLVSGIFALMFRFEGPTLPLSNEINSNNFFLPLMILIPGAVGIIYQQSQYHGGQAKKKKAALAKPAPA
jgi:hypothetical protein